MYNNVAEVRLTRPCFQGTWSEPAHGSKTQLVACTSRKFDFALDTRYRSLYTYGVDSRSLHSNSPLFLRGHSGGNIFATRIRTTDGPKGLSLKKIQVT